MRRYLIIEGRQAAEAKIAELDAAYDLVALGAATLSEVEEEIDGHCLICFDDSVSADDLPGWKTMEEVKTEGWMVEVVAQV